MEIRIASVDSDGTIRCGWCKHKLAESDKLMGGLGLSKIWIKCKHKSSGETCNKVSEIKI